MIKYVLTTMLCILMMLLKYTYLYFYGGSAYDEFKYVHACIFLWVVWKSVGHSSGCCNNRMQYISYNLNFLNTVFLIYMCILIMPFQVMCVCLCTSSKEILHMIPQWFKHREKNGGRNIQAMLHPAATAG